MNSGMIGKVAKAHRYAEEGDRVQFSEFTVAVRGDNANHEVSFAHGVWACTCEFFQHHDTCAHTMTLELILEGMMEPAHERAVA